MLRANRAVIKPFAQVILKGRIQEALAAARGYSTWLDPFRLDAFEERLQGVLADMPAYRGRGMILSAEELAGHMPGRDGLPSYRATPALMASLKKAFKARYPRPELHFVFTTRAPDAWLESAYWQHVKSSSMTMPYEKFRTVFAEAAQFDEVLADIEEAVAPYPVHRFDVDAVRALPHGPVDPILRLVGMGDADMAGLVPVPNRNVRPPQEVLEALLVANRTLSDRSARKAAKAAALAGIQEDQA